MQMAALSEAARVPRAVESIDCRFVDLLVTTYGLLLCPRCDIVFYNVLIVHLLLVWKLEKQGAVRVIIAYCALRCRCLKMVPARERPEANQALGSPTFIIAVSISFPSSRIDMIT